MIAKQWGGLLYWQQANPVTGSTRSEATAGYVYADDGSGELDPLGNDMGKSDPYAADGLADYGGDYTSGGNGFDESGGGCIADGMPRSCSETMFMQYMGIAEECPDNNCGPRAMVDRAGREYLIPLSRDPNTGRLGYHPRQWGHRGAPPQFAAPPSGSFKGNRDPFGVGDNEERDPQNPTVIPPPDFRTGINNLLNNLICANFVSALIYETASDTSDTVVSPTIMGVFDKLNRSGNVVFVPEGIMGPKGPLWGQASGNFANDNAKIEIAGLKSRLPPTATPENVQWEMNQAALPYSQTALGETIHKAGLNGRFKDRALAVAAARLTGIAGLPSDKEDVEANSLYFHHTVLSSKCK